MELFLPKREQDQEGGCFIDRRIYENMEDVLMKKFEVVEVKVALTEMHPLKAPGLDGLHAIFYPK